MKLFRRQVQGTVGQPNPPVSFLNWQTIRDHSSYLPWFLFDGVENKLCGITGHTHRKPVHDRGGNSCATQSMVHRGPDQQDTFESEHASLGAVRLKIIDLQGGSQPMQSADGQTVLVFNGEIYNYRELRAELEALGHKFTTKCDTEVVLQAFLQWDKGCFARLRGMFAAAFWNERDRRLILARDRLGIKPLYVYRKGEDLYFGSELKTLFAHPEIERKLDHAGLHSYLALNYVAGPRSIISGIEKVKPGHILEWRDGKVQTEPFWTLRFEQKDYSSVEAAEEELDALLKESVREHLIANVPVGIWLSGGVDSSTILHYARQAGATRLRTFSISFLGRSFDEGKYTREISRLYETEHHEMDLNPELDLSTAIEELVYNLDEPIADAGVVPVWFLSKLSRQHVTVALSGEGADELFGGYLTYRANELATTARKVPAGMRRGLLGLLRLWPISDDKISFEYKLKRFLEGSLLPPDEAHTYWNGPFSSAQSKELLSSPNGWNVNSLFAEDSQPCKSADCLNRFLGFDQRYYLCDDILQKVDRMSMAHSVEVRPPFLDHRIVEFAASLPPKWKIDGSRQKVILKRLMAGKLPDAVLRRKKTGLDIPAHDWLRGPLRALLLDTLSSENSVLSQLFSVDRVNALVQKHLQRKANLGFQLWSLLILTLWIKRWKIQIPAEN